MKHVIQEWVNGEFQPIEYDSMLEALTGQNVMTVEAEEGGFVITEACDNHFCAHVTPEQLRALGEELIALSHVPFKTQTLPSDGATLTHRIVLPDFTYYPMPASCPTCGREPAWLRDINQMLEKYYAVVCKCGLHGPVAITRPLAAFRWNEQAIQMKQNKL